MGEIWDGVASRAPVACGAHDPAPHHQRPAVHQRRQAPGQPGRVDAAGRRLRPVPAPARATRCCSSAPPTSTAPRPSWPPRRPGLAGRRVLPAAARRAEGRRRAVRAELGPLRAQLLAAEPRAHPALRRARWRRRATSRSAPPSRCTRPSTGASCPTATSSAPAPTAATTSARGDQCENCTRVLDPTDLIDPRSAISRQHRPRGARDQAPLPPPVEAGRRGARVGRGARRRVAGAHALDRPQVARPRACRTAASPATSTGACR